MRKHFLLLAACAVCSTAGTCDTLPPDSVIRAEITPEELEAAPGYNQMKAAIIYDVRVGRELDTKCVNDGLRETPLALTFVQGIPTCGNDKTEFEVFKVKDDPLDKQYRTDETAFYCRKEGVYYYHYKGGTRRLDVWMGPYRIDRKRVKPDSK